MLETKTIHVFGASNMRQIIPELEKHGYPVVDHTIPTPANISALSDSLSKIDKDSIVITDLLGNYAYRYSQMDGTLALPFKSDGLFNYLLVLMTRLVFNPHTAYSELGGTLP